MSSKRLTFRGVKADPGLLNELATASHGLSQRQVNDDYRVRIALVHVIAFSLSLAAIFASGRLLPLAETKEEAGVGIIWSSDCPVKQECNSRPGPSIRAFLRAGHVAGA